MPKMLTEEQVRRYHEDGAVHPVRVFSAGEARSYFDRLEAGEATGETYRAALRTKPHLAIRWVDEIVNHPRVLDAVEDLIGPDLLLYNLTIWIKNARDVSFVGWHQDSTYFPLDPAVQVTAWVALTESREESGNVKYVPGSHRLGQLAHGDDEGGASLLSKGQHIVVPFDASRVESISLSPGEMSLHHTRLAHYSEPNRSPHRRIGLGISYIPSSVRCTGTVRHTAMLVRGNDPHGHFEHEPRVRFDFDPEVEPFRKNSVERYRLARDEQAEVHRRLFPQTASTAGSKAV